MIDQQTLDTLFAQPKPAPTVDGYALEQQARHANYERFRAERLARDAVLSGAMQCGRGAS